ncbi:uncharacterized protein LOC132796679 isoform X1 [Drosophila nasuta]|uniref:uncharacterized protein LOC132796679 isoform X1 n=2 Tax=Drosophila nasuta TaxID=42062 RepID=UPI00295E8B09|nr:uncharacterized protein LOC132796679 isoform X1 [Drosophila nasuta]XP_060663911.1 uncharacterized protein LOC132796679 isoform X1 [Drosophila nasuta]XP_060663913.1 uncharacterized protein LOC132796679 isoform X1 [Drosophila nasuta]
MSDPSIGSSSPNWATLIKNSNESDLELADFVNPVGTNDLDVPFELAQTFPLLMGIGSADPTGGGQMSPYAPVFHPMGSYASHLLALEQAAQINPQSLGGPSLRALDGNVEQFFDRAEYNMYANNETNNEQQQQKMSQEGNGGGGVCGGESRAFLEQLELLPDANVLQRDFWRGTGQEAAIRAASQCWPGRECFRDLNQLIAAVASQVETAGGSQQAAAPEIDNDTKSTAAADEEKPAETAQLDKDTCNEMKFAEQQSKSPPPPPQREWWRAATFQPQQEATSSGWKPYSYGRLNPGAETKTNDKSCDDATNGTAGNSPNADFPSFEDFAKQVSDCSLSSSEYLSTLRNLMIRAHNLMLPLLRGRFANMSQVQMAAYTSAILEVTPLHPSIFLPAHLSHPVTASAGLFSPHRPHGFTHPDLAHLQQPRPVLVNVGTQTDYHCWCMHISMFPPPPLHMPPAPPQSQAPLQPPSRIQSSAAAYYGGSSGARMMAPCLTSPVSFWAHRPMVASPSNRVIVKQVNNIFLQPTGPVMPMMPMMHFSVPSNGGHAGDMPFVVYDINDNYPGAAASMAQMMPNVMNNMHFMPPDAMPPTGIVIPPMTVSMRTFKPMHETFASFEAPEESDLNEELADANSGSDATLVPKQGAEKDNRIGTSRNAYEFPVEADEEELIKSETFTNSNTTLTETDLNREPNANAQIDMLSSKPKVNGSKACKLF